MHRYVQRRHFELQAARGGHGNRRGRGRGLRLGDRLIRLPLLPLFAFLGRGGGGRAPGRVVAAGRHPDGDFAARADPRRRRDVLVAEARYRAVRDARRAGPARGGREVGEEGGVRALAEAEGDGHLLFADGLFEEAYVSVDLRFASRSKWRGGTEKKQTVAYRVVGCLREADLLLRSAHDLVHQPA